MTDKELDDGIKRTPAEDSPWGKFLLETIRLDTHHKKPRGWHWIWAFKDLSGLNLEKIQQTLPEEHPFKPIKFHESFLIPELIDAILLLKKELKNIGDIEKTTSDIEEINFSDLKFENADFRDFIFPVKVSFEYTRFYKDAFFVRAFFVDDADFDGAVFNSQAIFSWAIFNAKLISSKVVFKFIVLFTDVKFVGGANFGFAKFNNIVSFGDAIFFDEAFFDAIKMETHTYFTNTKFKKYPPNMHDAVLYSGIEWDRNVNLWPHPQIRKDNETDEKHKNRITTNQDTYENLASQMKKLDKYHDEHFFYRQEMRCRRWLTRYPTKCFYWLYETLSDYGYGIERALWGWFGHILAGIYFLIIIIGKSIDSGNKALEPATAFWCSIPTSFSNAHRVLSFHNGALSDCHDYLKGLYLFDVIWAFQSILGILFLFLLVLTVRIRFRLK